MTELEQAALDVLKWIKDDLRHASIGGRTAMIIKLETALSRWQQNEADDLKAQRLIAKHTMTVTGKPSTNGWAVGAVVTNRFQWLAWGDNCTQTIIRAAAEIDKIEKANAPQQTDLQASAVAQQLRQLIAKFDGEWDATDIEALSMAAHVLEQPVPVADRLTTSQPEVYKEQDKPVAWVGLDNADMDELAPYGQYAADVALLVEERLRERNAKQAEQVIKL